jgi:hypothetical protein
VRTIAAITPERHAAARNSATMLRLDIRRAPSLGCARPRASEQLFDHVDRPVGANLPLIV